MLTNDKRVIVIRCSGPDCNKAIFSDIHSGTWYTLKRGETFSLIIDDQSNGVDYFCSNTCLKNSL